MTVTPRRRRIREFGNISGRDCSITVAAAFASGEPIDGEGRRYDVAGNLFLPARLDLANAAFRQLVPQDDSGGRYRQTLRSTGGDAIRLSGVSVDRNGRGHEGYLNYSAGLYIDGGKGHHLSRVTVTGGGKGSGIVLHKIASSDLLDLHVHHLHFDDPDATDDVVNGIWARFCDNVVIGRARVEQLGGNAGGIPSACRTRGIVVAGSRHLTLTKALVSNVDQGIDFTGSDGNSDCAIRECIAVRTYSVGIKRANSAVRVHAFDCRTSDTGAQGFLLSGPVERGLARRTEDCLTIGCVALNPGRSTHHNAFGFSIEGSATAVDTTYPRGCAFVDCTAIDNRRPAMMDYGFRNAIVEDPSRPIRCVDIADRPAIVLPRVQASRTPARYKNISRPNNRAFYEWPKSSDIRNITK